MPNRLVRYLTLVFLGSGIVLGVLAIVYVQMTGAGTADSAIVAATLQYAFYATVMMIAIAAWPLILAEENVRTAREDASRRTALLMQEIEAHKRTDLQLQQARELADSRNVAKSRYVRGMSHELRTPLNAVLGYAQLLESDPALPDHIKHSVRVIRRSSDHLSGLVDGLLDISMIEAGRLQILKDEVVLPDFLAQIVDMVRLQARENGLEFVYSAPENLPERVHTDEKRLRQVLINLLSNAIRYTDTGQVRMTVQYSGQVARFDIEDTGIGISPADQARIFAPFERVEDPVRPRAGSGLGLTITRLLTEAMGGELTLSSTPGQGSRFTVRVLLAPLPAARRADAAPERIIIGYNGPRRTILLVDDDPNQIAFLRQALSQLGFSVLAENSGPAGIAQAQAGAPDIVLLDIAMPGMDGWTVARTLRTQMARKIPIIMISAFAPDAAASNEHHDAYLMKPVKLDRLLEQLGRLLGLEWITQAPSQAVLASPQISRIRKPEHLAALQQLGQIGHLRGILSKLDEISAEEPDAAASLAVLRHLTEDCDMEGYRAALKSMADHGN